MKLLSIIFLLIFSFSIHAATFTVTRTDDRNAVCNSGVDCSLREAVNAANAATDEDTINFSLSLPTTINLTLDVIQITNSVKIIGSGARLLTLSGGTTDFGIFTINNSGTGRIINASISGLTIANTISNSNHIIIVPYSNITLNVSDITMRNNRGTGIVNIGNVLNVSHSTFFNNTSSGSAISNSGGFETNVPGIANIDNSTISNNTYSVSGIVNTSELTLSNVTVSNNIIVPGSGSQGSGVYSIRGTVKAYNTIIASNNAPNSPDIRGSFVSLGNNLIGNSSGGTGFTNNVNGDIVGTPSNPIDPKLGDLQNNGGETDTRALLPGSPAIDKGNNSNSPGATDQRGFARIVNGIIDIGAFEIQTIPCTYSISPTSQNFTQSGGMFNIFLTTQPGCAFTSVSNSDFISIDYGANNAGTSNVGIFVLPNNTGSTRTGTLSIGGQTFTVTQAANKKRVRVVLF